MTTTPGDTFSTTNVSVSTPGVTCSSMDEASELIVQAAAALNAARSFLRANDQAPAMVTDIRLALQALAGLGQ